MKLSDFMSKNKKLKEKILMFGQGGIGKSTFASMFEDSVWIITENGISNIIDSRKSMDAFPKCNSFGQVIDYLNKVKESEHKKKTLVIDTYDGVELLCANYTLKNDFKGVKNGNKGYNSWAQGDKTVTQYMKEVKFLLDEINTERDMRIILLAHEGQNKKKNPLGEEYGVRTANMIGGSWNEIYDWCDIVGYMCRDIQTYTDSTGKIKATYNKSSERIIRFEADAGLEVKTRAGYEMPPAIPLDYNVFIEHLESSPEQKMKDRLKEVNEMLNNLEDEQLKVKVKDFMGENPTLERVTQSRNRLQAIARGEQ